MKLHDLRPAEGSRKERIRVGRGIAAGKGKTAGRGTKGQKARAGGKIPAWFEGGQMPLQRRTPKRGFINHTRVEYQPVAVARLSGAEAGTVVDREWLRKAGLVKGKKPVKLLGGGELKVALTVRVDAASESAKKAIEGVGGKIEKPVRS